MSAKKVISEKQIVDAACSIVAEHGLDGLNMRELAKRCNCSTQPIYLSFANADELKKAVVAQMIASYNGYITAEIESKLYPEYKATGMAYIRFAKEQPHFFKYLFMRNRSGEHTNELATEFQREADRLSVYGVHNDIATTIHTHMWVYVHGIATMFATGYLNWDWNLVSQMLTEEFTAIRSRLIGSAE